MIKKKFSIGEKFLKKFLVLFFSFLISFFCVDTIAIKKTIEKGVFSFFVDTNSLTATLLQSKLKPNSKELWIPEWVEDDTYFRYNIVYISANAFDAILQNLEHVKLPESLSVDDQNKQVIKSLLDSGVKVSQGNKSINKIEDFSLSQSSTENDWRMLNKFMNGY